MAEKYNGEELRKEGRKWLDRISASYQLEKTWHEEAEKAVSAYTGEGSKSDGNPEDWSAAYDFNVLYSNVETIVPAIINSQPAPDIRRRFQDDDPAAKDLSEMLERAIRVQVDDSQLMTELEATAQDAFLAGRGVIRVRFKSEVSEEEDELDHDEIEELAEDHAGIDGMGPREDGGRRDSDDPDKMESREGDGNSDPEDMGRGGDGGPDESGETVTGERVCFEAVSWRDYRHGPAKRWEDRPWEAFRHSIAIEDMGDFQDQALVDAQNYGPEEQETGEADSDVVVWEVWCKKTKQVKFIEQDSGKILKRVDDPLGLTSFFPTPAPVQPINLTGRLMPVNPFSIYRRLAEELDITTKRINIITKQMRVRGWYPGDSTDLANMLEAGDTDFVPISNAEMWAQNGGIANAVAFWPIEKFAQVLRELYANREQTKQAIYEITGISDIVRGATKASETLGAQEIKSQWGSLRIQKMQRLIQRCARDLFVMMSEIIPSKFSPETLQEMTGIQIIPTEEDMQPVQPRIAPGMPQEQQQQAMQQAQEAEKERQENLQRMEEINRLMGRKLQTYYRIDVETDSTVRSDLTRQKQETSEWLQASAQYFSSVGPLVQQGVLPPHVAVEVYASNARLFNLGKSTEDAIDEMAQKAREMSKQPQQPTPEQQQQKAEAEKTQMEMQAKQIDMQAKKQQAEFEQQKRQDEMAMARAEFQNKMQLEQQQAQREQRKFDQEMMLKEMERQLKQLEIQAREAEPQQESAA